MGLASSLRRSKGKGTPHNRGAGWGLVPVLLLAACAFPAAAWSYPFGWSASPGPAAETVSSFQCPTGDIGWDIPTRAFRFQNRNGDYRVQMNIGQNTNNRRLIGKNLNQVYREPQLSSSLGFSDAENRPCPSANGTDITWKSKTYGAANGDPTPNNFNNNDWLTDPYLIPTAGTHGKVYAGMHNEFHGLLSDNINGTPGNYCSANPPGDWGITKCWRGSIMMVTSDGSEAPTAVNDLGASYSAASRHLVASIPLQYYKDWGRAGYKAISNIVQKDGYYYILSEVSPPDPPNPLVPAQASGMCVVRTNNLETTSPWTVFAGLRGYIGLVNPYPTQPSDPTQYACTPVSSSSLAFGVRSLTYNTYLGKYMAVGTGAKTNPASGATVNGVYYSLSDDLINWTDSQLLLETTACEPSVIYPSILDPQDDAAAATGSQNPNFDHPKRTPYVYFTRGLKDGSCNGAGGDLARLGIKFEQRQANMDGNMVDPDRGFDSVSSPFIFQVGPNAATGGNGYGEGSQKFIDAQMYGQYTRPPISTPPHGTQAVSWKNGDDVWYGGALYLSGGFINGTGNVDIMRWDGANQQFGGVGLRTDDHKFHLVQGGLGPETRLGGGFDLPLGRWAWVEVHQRFGESSGQSPLNEVYVDGRLVSTSTQPNRTSLTGTIATLKDGFVNSDPLYDSYSWMLMDRLSVLGGEKGAVRGTGAHEAPDTPTGLTATGITDRSLTLVANTVPNATGYRLYRLNNGVWEIDTESSNAAFLRTALTCNTKYTYRITAFRQAPGTSDQIDRTESVVSAPLDATTSACP
jgi:hypothetical protein